MMTSIDKTTSTTTIPIPTAKPLSFIVLVIVSVVPTDTVGLGGISIQDTPATSTCIYTSLPSSGGMCAASQFLSELSDPLQATLLK